MENLKKWRKDMDHYLENMRDIRKDDKVLKLQYYKKNNLIYFSIKLMFLFIIHRLLNINFYKNHFINFKFMIKLVRKKNS